MWFFIWKMRPELGYWSIIIIATEKIKTGLGTTHCHWRQTIVFFNRNILHSGAAWSHLQCLANLQTRTCSSTFQPLLHCHYAAIYLLLGRDEGTCNISVLYSVELMTIHHRSSHLHSWDCADNLHFICTCNFQTLNRFRKFQLCIFGIHFLQIYF